MKEELHDTKDCIHTETERKSDFREIRSTNCKEPNIFIYTAKSESMH